MRREWQSKPADLATRLCNEIERLRAELNEGEKLRLNLARKLAAERERAICYRTEYPYCDADLDMHAEAMVASERERCVKICEELAIITSNLYVVETLKMAATAIRQGDKWKPQSF